MDRHRPLVFDVTHLTTRLTVGTVVGIEQVDLAFARTFCDGSATGLHYGFRRPHGLSAATARAVVETAGRKPLSSTGPDYAELLAWLGGRGSSTQTGHRANRGVFDGRRLLSQARFRVTMDGPRDVPSGALYLNIAQHAFEHGRFLQWLEARPDITPVFFIHDLLPLDRPEFFRDGYRERFGRRVDTIIRHAGALITSSTSVEARLRSEYEARGLDQPAILTLPLPSPLGDLQPDDGPRPSPESVYFVVLGTIEPRKNHLMLLHMWSELARSGSVTPKLVLVGGAGWDCGPTLAFLERSDALRPLVRRVDGLSPAQLRTLLSGARALLAPSFAEGYGLPIVEALTLGTPVIASDIAVFREVSQLCADFVGPLDGPGWMARVEAAVLRPPREQVRRFAPPTWPAYFDGVRAFLGGLEASP